MLLQSDVTLDSRIHVQELNKKVGVPIGLVHSSYGGSAVEDWMSKETLGDGKSGPCPGPIVHSMGQPSQQYNGQLRPLVNMSTGTGSPPRHRPLSRAIPTAQLCDQSSL